ncbi:MAG: zinc ABC transporter solute-binding protein, partial [Clostridiales bacterium]|nr:zinc ABC transporter solute-binding protein [Clostridiales bacterium]
VTGLMGAGTDPHLYQASAGDVAKIQNADVVVYTGLHLEGKMGDVFEADSERLVICIEDGLSKTDLILDTENYDPHIWFDVSLWESAAREVSRGLCAADSENEAAYLANLESYVSKLDELEQYITSRASGLNENQRVLITAHDAFKYFGRAYGFEVLGLQGTNTSAEAGTADVSALAKLIAERRISAVFIESSVPAKNVEALQAAVRALGFEVALGGELYSDSLGGSGSGCDTYIAAFRANVDTIVNALKAGAA